MERIIIPPWTSYLVVDLLVSLFIEAHISNRRKLQGNWLILWRKGQYGLAYLQKSSLILLVHKKDGTCRMRVQYNALNRINIKYSLIIEYLFDKLQGSIYFSRIDFRCCYYKIRTILEDILNREIFTWPKWIYSIFLLAFHTIFSILYYV